MAEKQYLSSKDLAERLNVSQSTVRAWRMNGTGPRYLIINKGAKRQRYRYPIGEVERWQTAQLT